MMKMKMAHGHTMAEESKRCTQPVQSIQKEEEICL